MFSRLQRLIRTAGRDLPLVWFALRNTHTPVALKLGAMLLAIYVISPIDLVPDALPVLGWLDDATLLALAIPFLLKFVPASALAESQLARDQWLSRWKFWR